MTKKAKATARKGLTYYATWQEAQDAFALLNWLTNEGLHDSLIDSLYGFYEEGKMESVVDFCKHYKIHRADFYDIAKRNPKVRKAIDAIHIMIANDDVKGVKHKVYDREMVLRYLHTLDPEWDAINKYHAKLKKMEGDEDKGDKYIIIREAKEIDLEKEIAKKEGTNV